eukprot:14727902-Alexandrium_andersonii.AAC.1
MPCCATAACTPRAASAVLASTTDFGLSCKPSSPNLPLRKTTRPAATAVASRAMCAARAARSSTQLRI